MKMPKRPFSDDDVIESVTKHRKLRSSSSERTLQLLYDGVSKHRKNELKQNSNNESSEAFKAQCSRCSTKLSSKMVCRYCEHDICPQCINICYKCNDGFCLNCSFPTYDQNEAVCYSCYS